MALRIVFFGTPNFAVPSLTALLDSPHQVVAVVTQPDRPRGRGHKVSDAPVKGTAVARGVPVLQPARLSAAEFTAPMAALDADLGVVAAYGKILPEWLLQMPRLGMINVHASLLPRWRGAAPIHRAVMNGDAETGITIMRVVKALDAGPMLASAARAIGPFESSGQIEADLAVLGAELLVRTIDDMLAGRLVEAPQDDALATYAPRLAKEDGRLDFQLPAAELHNQVRGLQPWRGAFTTFRDGRLAVHDAVPAHASVGDALPGTCLSVDEHGLIVACGAGTALALRVVQTEGRRRVTAREFDAGHGPLTGQRLG